MPVKLSLLTATHYRAEKLSKVALPSVLAQTCHDFEWIVVNDGQDRATRELIRAIKADFSLTYLEMEHPTNGFGLCHARNLGLEAASGKIVAYLDDDNTLTPQFVEQTLRFFQDHPLTKCSMVRQNRRRDVVINGQAVRRGNPFIAPHQNATAESLIRQDDLFDSNGFAHYQHDAPQWNPEYRVFTDYEYFLQCISKWGKKHFSLNPLVLVNYIQSSEGEIGKSNYKEWARELAEIYNHRAQYSVLNDLDVQFKLTDLIKTYEKKYKNGISLTAFI